MSDKLSDKTNTIVRKYSPGFFPEIEPKRCKTNQKVIRKNQSKSEKSRNGARFGGFAKCCYVCLKS